MKKVLRKMLPREWWLIAHGVLRRKQIVVGPFNYNEDGFVVRDQAADFLSDTHFLRAYAKGKGTGSWIRSSEIRWRVHVVLWAAYHASKLEGEFVECGVNRGGYARAIIEYLDLTTLGKKMYLFDTFEGIPADQISSEEAMRGRVSGGYEPCYGAVIETFRPYPYVQIIKGKVPETLKEAPIGKVCYLSLDMNIAAPEIAAAEFFWDRMVPGAILLLDDYNFAFHPVQRASFDKFAKLHSVSVLALPTGQGLILKP